MKKAFVAITLSVVMFSAFGHAGGTDPYGCHMDHRTGTWHCH